MKYILAAVLLASQALSAQVKTDDKKMTADIKTTIGYLADDKLEGRRTGSAGEKLAYEYIQNEFKKAGLAPFTADKNYVQAFDVNEGKEIGKETSWTSGSTVLELNKDYFPMPYSANITNFTFKKDDKSVLYYDLGETIKSAENNPHFDLQEAINATIKKAEGGGIRLVILTNETAKQDSVFFDAKNKTPKSSVAVVYLKHKPDVSAAATMSVLTPAGGEEKITIVINDRKRIGHNVIGYINNNAANTIIIGAHYDHLGYGEDHNSLYAGSTPMIHNGADDNASGTAALIELGKWLKVSGYKKYNYLLTAFSGEELGLFGSKYFTEHANIDLKNVNYMINMDMIGRLNDSTHGLTIGGFGTSPSWGTIINTKDSYFKINTDSSGSGPSDHTSFYRKDIPVLFFFTGSHKDYHKPSDDADKINYDGEVQVIHYIQNIIAQTDKLPKLAFTKTRDAAAGKTSSFKVSLGIMPDYTFDGSGVLVDGVSDNKPAQRAGIKTGDVLIQLGDHKFTDVQTYMDALNKFNKGESTNVKLLRGKEEIILPVTF